MSDKQKYWTQELVSQLICGKMGAPAGLLFYQSLDQLNREGKFPLEKVKSAIQKQREDITQKEFLSIKEFASKIGVHWFTVWRWTVEKRIHFKQVKSGCKILIPSSELLQFHASPEQSQHP